jgi:hypothetical protein
MDPEAVVSKVEAELVVGQNRFEGWGEPRDFLHCGAAEF